MPENIRYDLAGRVLTVVLTGSIIMTILKRYFETGAPAPEVCLHAFMLITALSYLYTLYF